MPGIRVPTHLREKLHAKTVAEQGALIKCFDQLSADPRIPGLRTKKIQAGGGAWEARAGRSNRVSWEWEDGVVVILNHCQHDEVLRNPRG